MPQPTPSVTEVDVARIIRRDFAEAEVATAGALVREYGREPYECEPSRVRLATLKLASGDLDALRQHIAAAKADFREVLLEAEYPHAGRVWTRMDAWSPDRRQAIYDKDWKQYEEWLKRP